MGGSLAQSDLDGHDACLMKPRLAVSSFGSVYPILYLDALQGESQEPGRVVNKADLLGFWGKFAD